MRSQFWEFYPPTDDVWATINGEALIVLDANALLHSYRLLPSTADAWLGMLEALADRVWVPHQAALEYQRNRLAVISSQSKLVTSIEGALAKSFDDLRAAVSRRQSDINRSRVLDATELEKAMVEGQRSISALLASSRERQTDLAEAADAADQIHSRLTKLLEGNIGEPLKDESLEALRTEGAQRYRRSQPPDYKDRGKDSNPEDPYGDLILWKEIISHCTEKGRPAVLVSEERKEDGVRSGFGRTLGPHPSLRLEFHDTTSHHFWLYSVARMLRSSSRFGHETDEASVNDAERIEAESRARAIVKRGPELKDVHEALERLTDAQRVPDDELREAVGATLGKWLTWMLRSDSEARAEAQIDGDP